MNLSLSMKTDQLIHTTITKGTSNFYFNITEPKCSNHYCYVINYVYSSVS